MYDQQMTLRAVNSLSLGCAHHDQSSYLVTANLTTWMSFGTTVVGPPQEVGMRYNVHAHT